MPTSDKLQGIRDLLILKVLSRRPNIHGYAIIWAIRQISEEILKVEDGSLHPALVDRDVSACPEQILSKTISR